jgi:transcriptional regulator NrdR family protein
MVAKWVTKKNGALQKFSKAKISKGCKKAGASLKHATWVANKVARKAYDKISTRRIGEMVVSHLRKVDRDAAASFNKVFKRNWKGL